MENNLTNPLGTYQQDSNAEDIQPVNYLGADAEPNESQSDLYAPMYIPINKKELGFNDDIELINEDELREKTRSHKINKQSVFTSYAGAQEKKGILGTSVDVLKGTAEGVIDGLVTGSWLGFWCDEDTFNAFQTKTAAGDFVHTLVKYAVVGGLALTGISAAGAALKVAKNFAGKNIFSKAAKGTAKLILNDSPFKWAKKNFVADAFLNKIFKPRTVFQGIYADYMAYNPKEGHLADILQQNDIGASNPLTSWLVNSLASNQNDTILEAKAKNVFEGLLAAPVVGVVTDLAPVLWKKFKNVVTLTKEVKKSNTSKEAVKNLAIGLNDLNTSLKQDELIKKCQMAMAQSIKNGTDSQEEIRKLVPQNYYDICDSMLENMQDGEELILKDDGTNAVKLNDWKDAYKVPKDEFKRQLTDGTIEYKNSVKMPKATQVQDSALYEVLGERGITPLENETQEDFLQRVVNYYKSSDKWDINNNIELSFVETIKGESKNGNHFGRTSYKNDKNGNLNIKIEIKKNAPNKLAILRAELEHARDKVKGLREQRPDGQEFFRYQDKNEQEWATTYLHKKAISRALREGRKVPDDILENYKNLNREKNYLNYEVGNEISQPYDKEAVSNFYKELNAAKVDINKNNVSDFENVFEYKLENLGDLPLGIKEALQEDINKTANSFYDNITNENTLNKIDNTIKSIVNSKTVQEANEHINELLTTTDLQNSNNAQKLVKSYAKDYQTRNHEQAKIDAENAYQHIRQHIGDDVLKSKNIANYLNPDFNTRRKLNDELLAMSRLKNDIWELIKQSHSKLNENPYDVQELFNVRTLLENYRHIEDVIIGETSQMGEVFNELKLSDVKGEGFKRIYTAKQRRQKDKMVQGLVRAYKNLSEDFFTIDGTINFSLDEIKKKFYDFLKSNQPDFNIDELDPKRVNAYAKYIYKETIGKTQAQAQKIMQDVFELHTQKDDLMDYLTGAINSQNITGFSAFKKYFGSNLAHNYVSSILSSPATQAANVLSGGFNMILEDAMKVVTGMRTGNDIAIREAQYVIGGHLRSLGQSLKVAIEAFKREEGKLANTRRFGLEHSQFSPLDKSAPRPLSAASLGFSEDTLMASVFNLFGNILRLPSRGMGTADEFMTHNRYYALSWADAKLRAENIITKNNLPSDMLDTIAQEYMDNSLNYFDELGRPLRGDILYHVRKNLYQQNLDRTIYNPSLGYVEPMERTTAISDFGLALEKIRGMSPAVTFIMPFIRTPVNIIEQLAEYTPASMLMNKYKMLEGFEKQLANTKIMFGSTAIASAALYAANGNITGSAPNNDEERKALTQSGWQPYSFVFTNTDGSKKYVSYKKLEPLASIIGLGADTMNLINAGLANDKDIGHITTLFALTVLNNALDKSYLNQSVETLSLLTISSENDANKMQRVIGNFVAGNIPYSSAANWYKNDGVIKEMRTYLDIIRQRNPFVTNDGVMPNRNYFGETRNVSKGIKSLYTRETYQLNDEADKEILRLSQMGYKPYRPLKMLGDAELDMTQYKNINQQTAYDRLLQEMGETTIGGKTLREAANALVESTNYQNLPDGILEEEDQLYKTKKSALNKLIKKYADTAKRNTINSNEYFNEKNLDLKTAQELWKQSRRLTRVVDINNQLNEIF